MAVIENIERFAASLSDEERAALRQHLYENYRTDGKRFVKVVHFERVRARYYESADGWRFCYTTEPCTDEKGNARFATYVRKAIGKGARKGMSNKFETAKDATYRVKRVDAKRMAQIYCAERDLALAKRAGMTRESLALSQIVAALRAKKAPSVTWPRIPV